MIERWLSVVGYEGRYEVSDWGRVRNARTGRVLRPMEKKRHNEVDYLYVDLRKDGRARKHYVHRLVLLAFVGPPLPGQECCHGPRGSLDNHWTNLRWGTRTENRRDRCTDLCPQRHRIVGPNLESRHHGWLACLACHRANSKIAYARKRGRPLPDLQVLSDKYYAAIMKDATA